MNASLLDVLLSFWERVHSALELYSLFISTSCLLETSHLDLIPNALRFKFEV